MSQPNAQKFCRAALSQLVEVNSREENEAIKAEINRRGFRSRKVEFWMGVTDRQSEGNWVWNPRGRVFLSLTGEMASQMILEEKIALTGHLFQV